MARFRTRSKTKKGRKNQKPKTRKTKSRTRTKSKSKSIQQEETHQVYIVAHGCYVNHTFDLPPETHLHFNQELCNPYQGDVSTIDYDPQSYPHHISNSSNDYFLDFKDPQSDDLFNSFGVYMNNVLIGYRGKTNILLSDIVTHLRGLQPNGKLDIYCGFCRGKCNAEDERKYIQMKTNLFEVDEDIWEGLADSENFLPNSKSSTQYSFDELEL